MNNADADKICVLMDALQNYRKISFKRLYKNLPYLFAHNFLCKIFQTDVLQT